MAGKGIVRFRLSRKRGELVIRAEGQSPRGSTYSLGERVIPRAAMQSEGRLRAVQDALDLLILSHGNASQVTAVEPTKEVY